MTGLSVPSGFLQIIQQCFVLLEKNSIYHTTSLMIVKHPPRPDFHCQVVDSLQNTQLTPVKKFTARRTYKTALPNLPSLTNLFKLGRVVQTRVILFTYSQRAPEKAVPVPWHWYRRHISDICRFCHSQNH